MSSITKTLEKLYNLDWNSSASKNECTAAVGLKWMLNQVKILDVVNNLRILLLGGVHSQLILLLLKKLVPSLCVC